MIHSLQTNRIALFMNFRRATVLLLIAVIFSLTGCGSTKVYTADKTLVYGGNLYNLSNVQRLGSRVETTLPGGEKVNLQRMDKKEISALLKENGSFAMTTYIEMDEKEFVYQNVRVKSYSDYSSVMKRHGNAMDSVSKFMANKKSTQLKLK